MYLQKYTADGPIDESAVACFAVGAKGRKVYVYGMNGSTISSRHDL
jgi:hypothetical protein